MLNRIDHISLENNVSAELNDYAYWITDFYNNSIERILSSSANLIGFVGIELGFIATWAGQSDAPFEDLWSKILLATALISLMISLVGFFITQINHRSFYPSLNEFSAYLRETEKEHHHRIPLMLMFLREEKTSENIFQTMVRIKSRLLFSYHGAIVTCLLAQLALSFLIFTSLT